MFRTICCLAILTAGMVTNAMALTLTTAGKSDYVIVVAKGAIAPEQTAAKELQTHLKLVTGAELTIVEEAAAPAGKPQIIVGQSEAFAKAFPTVDLKALKHDGIILRTVGDRLYLLGGRPRGTVYAVNTFLEDTVGVRWWGSRPDETFIPSKPTLTVPDLNVNYLPQLQYREAFIRGGLDGLYASRSKCNGHFASVPEEYGGHYSILGWCHTFSMLIPPDKYFAQHPEWFSEIGGKRVAEGAQLCLTNDEMRKELTANALAWLREKPNAGMISIAQNDCGNPCDCPNCHKVLEEEGVQSGNQIRFVNAVAADIEKEFPDTLVETLAYQYTRTPPKLVKPRRNVIVRLCSIEASQSQPLETGPQNAKFKSDIEGWSAIAPQLYIWNYVTDFSNYIIPHPNLRVLAPDIRLFIKHKTIGLFEQGDAGSRCSDFPELRAWLLAHLMWQPESDDKALIAEFLKGYYGAAAEPLQQYIDLINDRVEKTGTYLSCGMADVSAWMDLATANRATELFAQAAEQVKDDATLSGRVRRARLPLDHTWLQCYKGWKRLAGMTGQPFAGPADPAAAVEEYIKTANAFDIGSFREGGAFAAYEPLLRGRFPAPGKEATPPKEVAGLPADQWVDIQQGEFMLYELGHWVSIVDDAKASDGLAAQMTTNHNQWATQYPIPGDLSAFGKWHCYVVARVDAKVKEGNAFEVGLYDTQGAKGVSQLTVKLEQAGDGEYHTYDLGVQELRGGMYFWLAPMNNADQVNSISTDRIFLVREK
ncbi:MAG: DUF4838 domain-containing protein [Armatimonadota bacterium]